MYECDMYDGEDRVKQVNELRELAADIAYGDWSGTAEEKVEFLLTQEKMPSWFDDHDRQLLVWMIGD